MIKIIILLIIIVILLYVLPKMHKNVNHKEKRKKNTKKNKHIKESFVQPFKTEQDFLESVEGTMCDPTSEQINARLVNANGVVIRNITSKQLECIPICSVANSNVDLNTEHCIPCGTSTEENPGTITLTATQRCMDYSEDGMSYTVIQAGDELQTKPNCRYDVDFTNCPPCEVDDRGCFFDGPGGSCQRTVTVRPPIGEAQCTMDWEGYKNDSSDTNVQNYVHKHIASINSYTEKIHWESPHNFTAVSCEQCNRDCSLSSLWREERCSTACGQSEAFAKRYTKKIEQPSLNDGKDCIEIAQNETNYNDASYSIEGSFVVKSVPRGCAPTLDCCEVGKNEHYKEWTFADGTPVDWNGTDVPETCNTTYERTRVFDNTMCTNGNDLSFRQIERESSLRCCSEKNMNDYDTVYDYTYYDSQGNELTKQSKTDQSKRMTLDKNTVSCETKVVETKRFPFKDGVVCSNTNGVKERAPFVMEFENRDECPQDCILERKSALTACPPCKNLARDRPIQTSTWEVVQEQGGTRNNAGKACAPVFNELKTSGEVPSRGVSTRLGSTFSSYVECPSMRVCCNPSEPTHWESTDTYTEYDVTYASDQKYSEFEVSETGKSSTATKFDNVDNVCNSKIVKARTFSKTNACALNDGDSVESLKPSFSEERLSATRCPINCELSVSAFSECSGECGPGKKTRKWKVIRASRYGGQTCEALFNDITALRDNYDTQLDIDERVIGGGFKEYKGGVFTSEASCENALPCCNSTIEGHFSSNVSGYLSFTPWNDTSDYKVYSDETTEHNWAGSNIEGERLFNPWGEVPCNTTMKKRYSFTPNDSVCTGGEGPRTEILHEKNNENICPVDCEMSLVEDTGSNWSNCKDSEGNEISCKPTGERIPRRERSWKITQIPSATGVNCQTVFDDMNPSTSSKEWNEITETDLNTLGVHNTFKTYKNCGALKPCCYSSVDDHWNVDTVTYLKTTPFNSTDISETIELPEQDGILYFNGTLDPPDNTKIKKITSYIPNNETCNDGETEKANLEEVAVNRKVDCELNEPTEWSECNGNCGNGVKTRNWSIKVAPRINDGGKSCLEVFNIHSSRSNYETPIGTNVPNTIATTFETSIECKHEKDCCEIGQNEHWVVDQDENGLDKYYYMKYNRTSSNIPEADSVLNELPGSVSTEEEFVYPPCEKVVVKCKKVLRNLEACDNGYPSHYQVIELSEGRQTCDCEIDYEHSSEWNTSQCDSTCKDSDDVYYKTRTWSIINSRDSTNNPEARTCRDVFDELIITDGDVNETFSNISNNIITSRAPCNIPRCAIDCELSVSSNATTACVECIEPGQSAGFEKYTWKVLKASQYKGKTCDALYSEMVSDRGLNETLSQPTVPETKDETFETNIPCSLSVCAPVGTFIISEPRNITTTDFEITLTDTTAYQNVHFANGMIEVNSDDIENPDNIFNPYNNSVAQRSDTGSSQIYNNNVIKVSSLDPDTPYTMTLRRTYHNNIIPPIFSNEITFRTAPIHCDLEVTGWDNQNCVAQSCYTTNSPPTKTRTWRVIQEPSETGSNCSNKLTDSMFTNESIVGTNSLNDDIGSVITTRHDCDSISQCGQCGYGNWVYPSDTPTTWNGSSEPPCETTYTRTRTLNTTDCRNEAGLPSSQTDTRTNSSECIPNCSVNVSTHWNETTTRRVIRQGINQQVGPTYSISNIPPNPLPCNSQLQQTTTYSVKGSDVCINGNRTKSPTSIILNSYTNNNSCVTRPTLGTVSNITTNSFTINITSDGLFSTRNATVTKTGGVTEGVATINGNIINVTGLTPNTRYAVTLTNIGEDGSTSAYTTPPSNEINTLVPVDCELTPDTWNGQCYITASKDCEGLGTNPERNWTVTNREANGGRNCIDVFDSMKETGDTSRTGSPETLKDGSNPLTDDTFTSTKVCNLVGCNCKIRRKNYNTHIMHDWDRTHCNPKMNRNGVPCAGGYKTREWKIVHTGSGGPKGCTEKWQTGVESMFYNGERLLNRPYVVSGGKITGSASNIFKSIIPCEGDLHDLQHFANDGSLLDPPLDYCEWEGMQAQIPSREDEIAGTI
jgi:hypothetical protein